MGAINDVADGRDVNRAVLVLVVVIGVVDAITVEEVVGVFTIVVGTEVDTWHVQFWHEISG